MCRIPILIWRKYIVKLTQTCRTKSTRLDEDILVVCLLRRRKLFSQVEIVVGMKKKSENCKDDIPGIVRKQNAYLLVRTTVRTTKK